MAVNNKNAPDGTIVERRLRPIYDWLDIGNNKKALQEVEKVLKKSPTLQAAKALKALALLRLGKGQEAYSVLDALAAEKPCDDTTLQAMTISYRETHQLHKVCELYENAVKADPNNEELHSHLFMSYVRIGDYKSQQIAAMALYKFAPKNPYYFWAVMSIVLQAKSTEDQIKKKILLTLAQRMVDNFIADNKMEAEQEARLYIMILELQEKWADVLKFLQSPLYNKLVSGMTPQQTIPYLQKLGEWRKLNLLCKELLLENPDRWDFYMPYFDSVFQLMKESKETSSDNNSENESSIDDSPEKCHEFLCTIVESLSYNRILRGPYLARLELYKRLSVDGDPESLLGSGLALCLQYMGVFAHKACAVPDLRPYLLMISQKEREEHCRDFLRLFGYDENSILNCSDDIQRHVNCLIVWRLCAPPSSAADSLQLAATLRSQYLRCLQKGRLTSTLTEFCAADTYGILATHHYFYAAVEQKSSKPIIESVCLLELVLNNSPANFHVKLLLLQLYHVLGNALAADAIYQRLDVKHIQLVSLGWLHCARLPAAACPARALQLLADTRAFHHHHAKDSVEHLTFAYKFGTFEKLGEVGAWQARVGACSARALAERDAALLARAHERDSAQRHLPLPVYLTDNRDLNVIVDYSLTAESQSASPRRAMEQEAALIHLKDCLVTALSLCADLAKDSAPDVRSAQRELLVKCAEKFSNDMHKFKPMCSPEQIFISKPFPSRIIAFVNSPVPYRELYSDVLTMFAAASDDASTDVQAVCSRVEQLVFGSADRIREAVEEKLSSEDPVWFMREVLEELSNYLEFIGIITQTITLIHELLRPANVRKQKRKVSQTQQQLETSQLIDKINESVRHCIKTTEDLFQKLPQYEVRTIEQEMNSLNLDNTYICPVQQRLKNGQNDMVNDILNILKKNCKHLQSIMFH